MTGALPAALLDRIAPMHLVFDADGLVRRVGRTVERIAPGALGRPLAEVLAPRHPAIAATPAALIAQAERRLTLCLPGEVGAAAAPSLLRAVVHPLPEGGGLILLAFGPDVAAGVARHALAASDLAELDPTIELLLLLELKGALIGQHGSYAARLAEAGSRAERTALTDPLTGLANRRAVDRRLSQVVGDAGPGYGLMQLDLDYFKAVNDRMGHAAGDHVLAAVAGILRDELRPRDLVARVGGAEFLVLVEGCDDPDRLAEIGARLIARIERPIPFDGQACRISASIGATVSALYPGAGPDALWGEVDRALYASKALGRARYTIARPPEAGNARC